MAYTYNKGKEDGICHLTSTFHNLFWFITCPFYVVGQSILTCYV